MSNVDIGDPQDTSNLGMPSYRVTVRGSSPGVLRQLRIRAQVTVKSQRYTCLGRRRSFSFLLFTTQKIPLETFLRALRNVRSKRVSRQTNVDAERTSTFQADSFTACSICRINEY